MVFLPEAQQEPLQAHSWCAAPKLATSPQVSTVAQADVSRACCHFPANWTAASLAFWLILSTARAPCSFQFQKKIKPPKHLPAARSRSLSLSLALSLSLSLSQEEDFQPKIWSDCTCKRHIVSKMVSAAFQPPSSQHEDSVLKIFGLPGHFSILLPGATPTQSSTTNTGRSLVNRWCRHVIHVSERRRHKARGGGHRWNQTRRNRTKVQKGAPPPLTPTRKSSKLDNPSFPAPAACFPSMSELRPYMDKASCHEPVLLHAHSAVFMLISSAVSLSFVV